MLKRPLYLQLWLSFCVSLRRGAVQGSRGPNWQCTFKREKPRASSLDLFFGCSCSCISPRWLCRAVLPIPPRIPSPCFSRIRLGQGQWGFLAQERGEAGRLVAQETTQERPTKAPKHRMTPEEWTARRCRRFWKRRVALLWGLKLLATKEDSFL